jgi:HAD superfamily hydrolase (TIGR01450 family)
MSRPQSLAERHDALLMDLDGTLALAGQAIDHAADTVRRARELGSRVLVVTNNASASPESVARRLSGIGISLRSEDVVSSPLAAATMLAASHRPTDPVLIVGAAALADAVAQAGLTPVRTAAEHPVAVVQGHSPDTGWRDLAEACIALRDGVDWVATNVDPTLPTDRGMLPGNGSMVQVLVTATGRHPRVAGKPARPLLDAAVQRAGARRPLMVGDRLDTDIAAAVAAGIPSMLVLTGASTAADVLAAPEEMRPTVVAMDLRGLLDPEACGRPGGAPDGEHTDADWEVTTSGDRLELHSGAGASGTPVAALAALAGAAWSSGITRTGAGDDAAAEVLAQLGLA